MNKSKRFTNVINELEKPTNICPKCETPLHKWVMPNEFFPGDPWIKIDFCQGCMTYWTNWSSEEQDDSQ